MVGHRWKTEEPNLKKNEDAWQYSSFWLIANVQKFGILHSYLASRYLLRYLNCLVKSLRIEWAIKNRDEQAVEKQPEVE